MEAGDLITCTVCNQPHTEEALSPVCAIDHAVCLSCAMNQPLQPGDVVLQRNELYDPTAPVDKGNVTTSSTVSRLATH